MKRSLHAAGAILSLPLAVGVTLVWIWTYHGWCGVGLNVGGHALGLGAVAGHVGAAHLDDTEEPASLAWFPDEAKSPVATDCQLYAAGFGYGHAAGPAARRWVVVPGWLATQPHNEPVEQAADQARNGHAESVACDRDGIKKTQPDNLTPFLAPCR
jgi:hypothetical protein